VAGRKPRDSERFRKAFRALGERIGKLRAEHGWTQDALAEKCGMSGTAIGEIERAEAFMTIESLFLVAAALDVSASNLIAELDAFVGGPSEFVQFERDQL